MGAKMRAGSHRGPGSTPLDLLNGAAEFDSGGHGEPRALDEAGHHAAHHHALEDVAENDKLNRIVGRSRRDAFRWRPSSLLRSN